MKLTLQLTLYGLPQQPKLRGIANPWQVISQRTIELSADGQWQQSVAVPIDPWIQPESAYVLIELLDENVDDESPAAATIPDHHHHGIRMPVCIVDHALYADGGEKGTPVCGRCQLLHHPTMTCPDTAPAELDVIQPEQRAAIVTGEGEFSYFGERAPVLTELPRTSTRDCVHPMCYRSAHPDHELHCNIDGVEFDWAGRPHYPAAWVDEHPESFVGLVEGTHYFRCNDGAHKTDAWIANRAGINVGNGICECHSKDLDEAPQ